MKRQLFGIVLRIYLLIAILASAAITPEAGAFKVCVDAGHGGDDPGRLQSTLTAMKIR
jgi:N-acetylmuramoyl-L-alanine amidase